jgi:hypothetical protein
MMINEIDNRQSNEPSLIPDRSNMENITDGTHREPGDSACTVDVDGNVSNSWLHDQMLKGLDDEEFRQKTRQHLIDLGMTPEEMDSLIPLPK